MVLDERSRHHLYLQLEGALGAHAAATLMEHLPPVGWADVATKRDLDQGFALFRTELMAEIALLRSDLTGDMAALRSDLTGDMAALRSDMTADMAALRSDMTADMAALRSDMTGGLNGLRNDLTQEIRGVVAQLAEQRVEFHRELRSMLVASVTVNLTALIGIAGAAFAAFRLA